MASRETQQSYTPRDTRSRSRSRSRSRHRHDRDRRPRSPSRDRYRAREDDRGKKQDTEREERRYRLRSRSPVQRSRSRSRDRYRKRSRSRSRSREREPERRRDRSKERKRRSRSRSRSVSSDDDSDAEDRKHGKRKSHKRKRSRSRDRKERKKEKKKDKKKKKSSASSHHWGKYGIINETDLYNKEQEFRTWLVEERMINPETISKDQTKKEFAKFVEDYNTATLPHEKFYSITTYETRMAALRSGSLLPPSPTSATYDPTADLRALQESSSSSAKRRRQAEGESYLSREQLMELRRVQAERVEVGKMKLLGMEVRGTMGVRMDGTAFDE